MKTAHPQDENMDIIPPSPVQSRIRVPLSATYAHTSASDIDSRFPHSDVQSESGDDDDELSYTADSQQFGTSGDAQHNDLNESDSSDDNSEVDLFEPVDSSSCVEAVCIDTDLQRLIEEFKQHVASIDGGAKVRPEAYSLAAKQILNAVGNNIALLTKDKVYSLYVNPMLTQQSELRVKTIRTKLKHLEYFCKYLIEEKAHLLGAESAEMTRIISALPAWRQSLKRKCLAEDVARRVQDVAERIYPKDIATYLLSDYAKSANHLLISAGSASGYSSYDFIRARNHLLVLLSVSNAHRTGVLTNFTINDYKTGLDQLARTNAESLVFMIAEHKTAGTHGAATLAVSSEEGKLLAGYMAIRQKCEIVSSSPFVFVTQTGKHMTQSLVSSALTAAFAASGYPERVNCTKLRKAAVTQVHSKFPDKRTDLAAHMLHRTNTAESTYRMIAKSTNTVACSKLLRETMSELPEPQTSAGCASEQEFHQPYQRRISWSIENRDLIRAKFDSFVKREQTPIKEIQAVLESDPVLLSKLELDFKLTGKNLVSVVKDKVRSFFRAKYGFGKR